MLFPTTRVGSGPRPEWLIDRWKLASRIRRALPYIDAATVLIAPDCGTKCLPIEVAFEKLPGMVAGAQTVRAQLE